ncbi:DUF1990 family protein [Streptomyces sp. H27-D2]|uniref:DUF1990 family protein n=1 Tax=Streptomyces sp. H27-D2 TaxID=3046304 RepID=UPI002DC026AC|nr:DUF1990 domain-containing protein [Streptomyces sp. H27-D2]MEC4020782.1 DUF1990 domain-containing protein [Streptomyces sp. H27-D2]
MGEITAGHHYAEVGATRDADLSRTAALPPGYHHLRVRTLLGHGPGTLRAAGEALLDWRMHRAVGVSVEAGAPRAAPGVRVTVGLGVGRLRLRAPCRVVWTVEDGTRIGFGYGALSGHPESGEESFVVALRADGSVVLTVTAFSRPARWFTKAAGPLAPVFQRAYARRCGTVLRSAAAKDLAHKAKNGR